MQIINNRYKIIEKLNEEQNISVYLCSDMWNEDNILRVNIMQKEIMTDKLKAFYIDEFIGLNNIDNDSIIKNFSFDRVLEIDNRENIDEQYFYTSEHIEDSINLFEHIEDKSMFEIVDICIDICTALHYLHMYGYVYGAVNLDSISFVKIGASYKLKLKDIATIKLEEAILNEINIEDESFEIFKSNGISFKEPRFDMHSLGMLFINMITRGECNFSPSEILEKFKNSMISDSSKNITDEESIFIFKILPVVEKLFSMDRVYPYRYIYEFIDEINEVVDGGYSVVDNKKNQKLNIYSSLVGREGIIKTIKNAYKDMMGYKGNENIFFVEGNSGAGKTRILKELDFLLRLDGANIYSSFKINALDDDIEVLEGIFNNMILDGEKHTAGIAKSELKMINLKKVDFKTNGFKKSFNNLANKDHLLNKMAKFIIDDLRDKPSVIIIDNINLATEFTIDIVKYIYSEIIKDKNIILILSYSSYKTEQNKKVAEFIESLKERNESISFKLGNLNIKEEGEMIKNILSMDHVPEILSQKIYDKSYGNPLFITEIIKELYSSKSLFRTEESGLWHIDIEEGDTEYKSLEIPNNIEQAILNQLKDISDIEKKIMDTISISFDAFSLEDLKGILSIESDYLKKNLDCLVYKGILSKVTRDHKEAYETDNKVLSDIIYNNIPEELRISTHALASEFLESRIKNGIKVNLDELIYHLEKSLETEKIIIYLIQNFREKYISSDITGAMESLDKALMYIKDEDLDQKINLLLKKAEICLGMELVKEAMESLEKVESLNSFIEDLNITLKINILKSEIYLLTGEFNKMKYFLDKVYNLLKRVKDLDVELRADYIRARILFSDDKLAPAVELCKEIIDRCGNIYKETKGNTYRLLASIYTNLNKFQEALELNQKAIELHESIGYTRGVIYALNNTGNIYHDNYQNSQKALEYYDAILKTSKEYKIISGELLALSNIGTILYDSYDYELSYYYLKKSLKKALQVNYKHNILFLYRQLTILCLDKGEYSKAYKYYILALEKSKDDKSYLDELKIFRGEVYYNLGAFDKALRWTKEGLDYFQDTNTSTKYKYNIRYYLLQIIVGSIKEDDLKQCIDNIIQISRKIEMPQVRITELSKIAESLYRKSDEENANKIFRELENSADENIDKEGRGYYHYVKGMLSSGKDSIESLMLALKLAGQNKNKLLVGNTKIEIGNYYHDKKDHYNAVSYYVDAAEIIRNIIYDVPDRYKLDFVNNYYYVRFFYKLANLMDYLLNEGKNISGFKEKTRADSLEELSILISTDYNVLARDKNFIDKYRQNFLGEMGYTLFENKNIMEDLDNDIVSNLEMILEHLSHITLASGAQVVIEEDENLTVIACVSEDAALTPSKYAFARLKTSMEPILITSKMILNENETGFLHGDLKAGMYIPIASSFSKLYINRNIEGCNKDNKILGYIYLESKNTINNFNEEILIKNIGLINIVSILCKKYRLIRMATVDKLTGALTRKYFEDDLENIFKSSQRNGEEFSIIMYDLDRFKRINDKFGHQTGDDVLRKVSKLVIDNIDKKYSLGRYGGEEFIIILPETGSQEAVEIANSLREKIYSAKILGDLSTVSVSSGVASYPEHGKTSHQLIEKVDQALYNAKENGRNKSVVWNKKITNKKPASKIDDIVIGEDVIDSRNMLAIVEIMDLMNSGRDKEIKIDLYLDRLLETLDADCGYLLLVDDGKIVKSYEKKARQEKRMDYFFYDKTIVEDIITSKEGIYTIDWNDMRRSSIEVGVPIWSSILAVPIIREDRIKGVIYLVVSSNSKEFGVNDFNFTNIYSNLLHV